MNIVKILDLLSDEGKSLEEKDTLWSRRESFSKMSSFSKKLALAAVPTAVLAAMPKIAFGQTSTIVETLNFALTLEYLEDEYYKMGLASGVIPSADAAIFQQISKHEDAHVTFLSDTIVSLNGTPANKPTFDFTANGAFDPFNDYAQFAALAQAFEDTGVRAYKGQAGNVMSNDAILTAALQIHSVEARHASEVRRLRNKNGMDMGLKGWITSNDRGSLPAPTQAIYDGEDNVTQGGVDVTTLTTYSTDAVTESFDEPLSKNDVLSIAGLFIQ